MAKKKEDRGNYRSIYSVMLDDPDFQALPADARYLFLILKISRLNNSAGIFILDDGGFVTLEKQSGMSLKRIKKAFRYLSDTHSIAFRYPIVWLKNSLKYEPGITLSNEKHKKGIENILKSLPKNEIVLKFCDYYNLAYPFDTPSIPLRNKETETDTETEKETENTDVSDRESVQDRIQKLLGLYHEKCPSLPTVKFCKPYTSRHRSVMARISERGDDNFWPDYFTKVEASDFLAGREKKWRATFDWIMNPTNMTKILEGNYDNRDEPRPESGATAAEIEAARKARSKYS